METMHSPIFRSTIGHFQPMSHFQLGIGIESLGCGAVSLRSMTMCRGCCFDSKNVIAHLHGLCLAGRVSKSSTAIQGGTPVRLVSWHLDSRLQLQDAYIISYRQKSRSFLECRDGAQVSRLQCLLHWESIVVTSFYE